MPDITRVLRCDNCRSLEPLPDFDGPSEHDHLLTRLLQAHKHPDGSEHTGLLFRVETEDWDSPTTRAEIVKRIQEESGYTGLDPNFYDVKATFEYDALICWQTHHRNPHCNEYKSDRKLLTPDTKSERKEAGIGKYNPKVAPRYLCEFCPVHTLVMEAARWKAGLYK